LAATNRLQAETADLVEQNWPAIERVADALLSGRFLNQEDIDALIADGHRHPAV
jgi:hypothetical protein